MSDAPDSRRNSAGLTKMIVVAIGAFALTFALVPLYRIACEKVFGIRLERTAAQGVSDAKAAAAKRVVTVQFDGGVNSKLPWEFSPNRVTMQVVPGEQYEATYHARNTSDRTIVGSAVPSVAPAARVGFFNKTDASASPPRHSGRRSARHAGAFHRRPEPAGRREDHHPVVHLLQERRADRAAAGTAKPAASPLSSP
jgi:cytochrome c oxidase assembly protein subunit 11